MGGKGVVVGVDLHPLAQLGLGVVGVIADHARVIEHHLSQSFLALAELVLHAGLDLPAHLEQKVTGAPLCVKDSLLVSCS